VYFLSSGGGLWKTTNFTHPKPTWTPLTDGLYSNSGGSVAFGRDPNTLYLGLGDPFDFPLPVKGVMYKSTDGGRTWSAPFDLPFVTVVADIKVDTSGPQDVVLVGTEVGLYRSMDGGTTYTLDFAQPMLTSMVWSLARSSAGWLAAAESNFGFGTGTIYVSTNRGATWSPVPNAGNAYSGAGRTTLGVGRGGDAVVYAYAADTFDNVQKDLFRSADGGLNWQALNINAKIPAGANESNPDMDLMGGQAFYNQLVLVDPSVASRNTLYLGGQLGSAKSTDGGQTWALTSEWLGQYGLPYVHADFHAAAYSGLGKSPTVFFGTDGGLFISRDGGRSWDDTKNKGLVTHLIYALSSSPKHADRTLVGLQDNGSRYRRSNSTTYNQVLGGDGFGTGWSQANDRINLASVYTHIFVRNENGPPNNEQKWDLAIDGIDRRFAFFFTALTTPTPSADPTGQVFFTYTTRKVYMTTNGALTWTDVSPSVPITANVFRGTVHGLGVSPDDLRHIGVAGLGGTAWFTADGGATWTLRNLNATGTGFNSFVNNIAYADANTIYASSENPDGVSTKVIKSTNGGATWTAADNGLPKVPVMRITHDPRDASRKTLYAGTYLGVYRTTDGGASWHRFGNALPSVVVTDLYMPPDGSFLRVSTFGRGVWEVTF
jgi:photosystem II stability/assembly factor-like uncharacterized protein